MLGYTEGIGIAGLWRLIIKQEEVLDFPLILRQHPREVTPGSEVSAGTKVGCADRLSERNRN